MGQLYGNNGDVRSQSVTTFQDEVYKPHKKFRRHNSSFSKDDCPTSSTTQHHGPDHRSASPPDMSGHVRTPGVLSAVLQGGSSSSGSLLASQLSEPPLQSSLLASTLSQGIPLASEETCKRNEILAQLILDGSRKQVQQHQHAPQAIQQQKPQQQPHQGLLMCAWADSHPASQQHQQRQLQRSPAGHEQVMRPVSRGEAAQPVASVSATRHIPVATLPTKPINRCPMAAAAAGAAASATAASPASVTLHLQRPLRPLLR